LAALGGAVFFALMIVFGVLMSNTPSITDSSKEVFDYFAKHHDRIQGAAVMLGLAMPAALLWLSGLFRALRKAEGRNSTLSVAALGGGILTAATTTTTALILGTVANRFNDLGPSGTRIWWTMYLLSLGAILLGFLLLIGATATVCLRNHLFPRWFALASVALAVASLVGACTIGYAYAGIWAVAGIAVILDGVWVLLVSRYLWRDPELALS
jgi:hypothetical protein